MYLKNLVLCSIGSSSDSIKCGTGLAIMHHDPTFDGREQICARGEKNGRIFVLVVL